MKTVYRMRLELNKLPSGATARLAKELNIRQGAVNNLLKEKRAGYTSMEKYTKAFNKVFKTEFSEEYLFELVENEKE